MLLFMFIRRELGGTGTGCLFQFTYCGLSFPPKETLETWLPIADCVDAQAYLGEQGHKFNPIYFRGTRKQVPVLRYKIFRVEVGIFRVKYYLTFCLL